MSLEQIIMQGLSSIRGEIQTSNLENRTNQYELLAKLENIKCEVTVDASINSCGIEHELELTRKQVSALASNAELIATRVDRMEATLDRIGDALDRIASTFDNLILPIRYAVETLSARPRVAEPSVIPSTVAAPIAAVEPKPVEPTPLRQRDHVAELIELAGKPHEITIHEASTAVAPKPVEPQPAPQPQPVEQPIVCSVPIKGEPGKRPITSRDEVMYSYYKATCGNPKCKKALVPGDLVTLTREIATRGRKAGEKVSVAYCPRCRPV